MPQCAPAGGTAKDGETVRRSSKEREDRVDPQFGGEQRSEPDGFVEVAAVGDLGDGQMVGVQIDGERVVLANLGGEFYAISGICTHERAKLDEGALHEGVIYCPLHYSSFDVRSGEVLGPPADKPARTYSVKVENEKVLVSTQFAAGGSRTAEVEDDADEDVRNESLHRARPWHTRLSDGIDSIGWLGRLTDWVMARLTRARARLGPAGLLDLLHGRWLGHSLHPALSDLPIGLWASSLLLYVIDLSHPAAILSVVGTASALGAAATGVADLSVAEGHERRAGLLHGLLMTGALIIHAGSAAAYLFASSVLAATVLAATGLAITIGAAYLGGHLVFGYGTMVNHTCWPPGPVKWVRTVKETELDAAPGKVLAVDAGEKGVLLHRNGGGRISAIHNACSHAGASLSLGKICDGVVTCPWHDSKFRLSDGAVLQGPAIYPQPVFEVRVSEGWIEIRSSG